jgi:hypothetical protein
MIIKSQASVIITALFPPLTFPFFYMPSFIILFKTCLDSARPTTSPSPPNNIINYNPPSSSPIHPHPHPHPSKYLPPNRDQMQQAVTIQGASACWSATATATALNKRHFPACWCFIGDPTEHSVQSGIRNDRKSAFRARFGAAGNH